MLCHGIIEQKNKITGDLRKTRIEGLKWGVKEYRNKSVWGRKFL